MLAPLEVDEFSDFGNPPIDGALAAGEFMRRPQSLHIGVQSAHGLNRAWFRPQPTST